MKKILKEIDSMKLHLNGVFISLALRLTRHFERMTQSKVVVALRDQRGDVPGWVLVVLMTTGLVTAIWTIAAPRLTAILKNSLDAMNGIR